VQEHLSASPQLIAPAARERQAGLLGRQDHAGCARPPAHCPRRLPRPGPQSTHT